MNDHTELKRLAEECKEREIDFADVLPNQGKTSCDKLTRHYIAAAYPETILALIVERDAYEVEADKLAMECKELRDRQKWLPIETAPKDFSTEFDGWSGERIANVIWGQPDYSPKGYYEWCTREYERNHGWVLEAIKGLTHWMPLPKPPEGI